MSDHQRIQIGNLTNPHWQSEKELDFATYKKMGVSAIIASWVATSDEDAALQFLPNDASETGLPALYVGNSTGELIRELVRDGNVASATVVLDAPTVDAKSQTVIGHLDGTGGGNETIIVYTHSEDSSKSASEYDTDCMSKVMVLQLWKRMVRHR